ncbi:unnamed protein product [Rotaria magnacalcarata]|uniref:FAD dependent oxidoreductase domain-containing protein n=3 Tax=Rotaria magnacalcarata TaxID=392030 RepID=A0A816VR13_9BILA|nr:unnamed protein product [Rotaria magnacalcarata]CAF1377820.1 unnamed protein product [Rotaria magnacalcarata]CAF2127830.1 unnamed protein product [Rotaria magnacalcarata]CAF2234097.1 unnamed protein product [Rotaria magnacalcarata]
MLRRVIVIGSTIISYGYYKVVSPEKPRTYIYSNRSKHGRSVTVSLIIGTGIIGLTSAYYLAKSGHKVICIEKREDVALETSYKNGSLICPSLLTPWANSKVPKKYLKSIFSFSSNTTSTKIWPSNYVSMRFYRWMYEYLKNCTTEAQAKSAKNLLALSMYSRQCLDDILSETSISFSRCSIGSLQLAEDSTILEEIIEESKLNENIQILSTSDEVIKHEPILAAVKDRLHGGVFSSSDTNGNIYEFCCELKKILIEKYGVQFLFNQEIKSFIVDNTTESLFGEHKSHISGVKTNSNQVIDKIDNIILTNGNYIMPLMEKLKMFIPVYPVKGYVVEIATPPNIPFPSMNLVDDGNKLYISALKPNDKQGIVRVSGLAEFAGWKDIGVLSEPDRAQYLYEQTIKWLPHLEPYEKTFHSCSRPVSADDVPLIGQCGNFNNLFLNCGHGSKGWTLAFGSAALLDNIINGKPTAKVVPALDPDEYSPNRF